MEMLPVQSSEIAAIGHDGRSCLRILFRGGGLYEYAAVSSVEFDALKTADSIGRHFSRFIKGAKRFTKVDDASRAPSRSSIEAPAPSPDAPTAPLSAEAQAVSCKSTELTCQAQAADVFNGYRRVLKERIGAYVVEQQRLAGQAEEALRRAELVRAQSAARAESMEQALADALALEAKGDFRAAEAILAHPAPAPLRYAAPAPVAPRTASVPGVTTHTDWDFRIVDEPLIPREYLLVNESAIRTLGKATKGKARVPGVEFFSKPVVAASRSMRLV